MNGNNYTNGHSNGLSSISASKNSKSNELFDFKQFYSILRRHIWTIVLCAFIGVGAAYYLAYEYFLPTYRSDSTLLIESAPNNFPGGTDEISKIISSSYNLSSSGTINSQIYFLKSRELSEEVAKQLIAAKHLPDGSLYPILWANYPDDSTMVSQEVVAGRIRRGMIVEPVEQGANLLSVAFESYSPTEAARIVNFSLNAYKDITADKKRESAKSALDFLQGKREEVKSELEQAENQLSGFKNNQNLVAIESQTTNLVNAVSDLQNQKQQISVQLEAVRSGIENYEKQLKAIKPGLGDRYSEAAGPTITNYQGELAKLQTERLILVSNNPQLKNNPDSEPKMRKLDKQIADLKAAIKQLTDNLMAESENSLGLLAGSDGNVTKEISQIQSNLTQLHIQESQYEAQLQAINQRLQNNETFLNKVPENQKQLARLQRQATIYEELFKKVNDQASEVSLWEQTQSSAGTVIDYAHVSSFPVKPQKPLWLFGGFLLGLILPVGFMLIKEAVNGRINSIQNLENYKYPLLATIYDHSLLDKKKAKGISRSSQKKNKYVSKDLILYHYGLSPIAESYRSLVSKILYSNPDNPPKTLLITSPGAGEGKTTLTANIATGLSEAGNNVLIIDCDMRKPGIPGFFGISKEPGFMEILFKDYSPEETIRNLPLPGLDVLTSGKKQPAHPTSVISSQSFKKLIEYLKHKYDFILLDSAPFGIIGDTAPLLHITDGVIVNSRFLVTKHVELSHTLEELEDNSAHIIGLVLNGYEPKKGIDDVEVKSLYNKKYTSYYDYHKS